METAYFLDTYALIEISKENKNFKKFEETANFTGIMNLLEIHYIISKSFNARKADEIIEKLKKILVEIQIEDIRGASAFRLTNIKRDFSYIDCLGYVMALNRNLKFVTGDNQFKDLKNVEFVK
jgi:predicted nucleic acid-binding protein